MYKILKSAFLLFTAMAITQCSKEENGSEPTKPNNGTEQTKPNTKPNDFSIGKNEINLEENQTGLIEITSGNGDYKIIETESSRKIASAELTPDKKNIKIKAIKEGKTDISIIDNKVIEQTKIIHITVNAKLKDFSIEKNEVSLKINENTSVNIISGNDEYEIQTSEIAKVTLSTDKKSFSIEGLKAGNAEIVITDKKSKKSITLTINVTGLFVENTDYTLSSDKLTLTKWKNTSIKDIDMKSDALLSKITKIGDNAFNSSTIESIIFPETLKTIGKSAFATCIQLNNIEFNNNLTEIGEDAFSSCTTLSTVKIPNSVKTIGKSAFANNGNLSSVTLPEGLTAIEEGVFSVSNLASINIPKSVTSIGNDSFFSCNNLKEIIIPEKVSSIGENAFGECLKLKKVTIKAQTPPTLGEETLGEEDEEGGEGGVFPSKVRTIYVPKGKAEIYKTAEGWSNYKSKIQEEK